MLMGAFGFTPTPAGSVSFSSATPATVELDRRIRAAGITGEQAARDWIESQSGLPFRGVSDDTAKQYLSAIDARAAAAASQAAPTAPPPPAGISMTTVAIAGAAVLGAVYLFTRGRH